MIEWLGRLMRRSRSEAIAPEERVELALEKARHVRLLERADEAIHAAMEHADDVFVVYRGPERRSRPR